jgi:hypothetical protein
LISTISFVFKRSILFYININVWILIFVFHLGISYKELLQNFSQLILLIFVGIFIWFIWVEPHKVSEVIHYLLFDVSPREPLPFNF